MSKPSATADGAPRPAAGTVPGALAASTPAGRAAPARCRRRLRPLLLILPLAAVLVAAPSPSSAGSPGPTLNLPGGALADEDLSGLRGGFSIGGFDLAVGMVARSLIDESGSGRRLEVVNRYSVPAVGRLAHDGSSVQVVSAADGTAAPVPNAGPGGGLIVSTTGAGTTIDLGGTTLLTQHGLNTVIENSDLNRAISHRLDVNLKVGGLAQRLAGARAARTVHPAVQAQVFYRPR